jgi:hypothetical protein
MNLGYECIQHANCVPLSHKLLDKMRANETRSPTDQDVHLFLLRSTVSRTSPTQFASAFGGS